jgi:hypothetical protein
MLASQHKQVDRQAAATTAAELSRGPPAGRQVLLDLQLAAPALPSYSSRGRLPSAEGLLLVQTCTSHAVGDDLALDLEEGLGLVAVKGHIVLLLVVHMELCKVHTSIR